MTAPAIADTERTHTLVAARGDRPWAKAAAASLAEHLDTVRGHAKELEGDVDIDAVHDMRTATRRLRTAITIYGGEAPNRDRKAVEAELRRIARHLGAVRDLDVLLETLSEAGRSTGSVAADLRPLREAWEEERRAGTARLQSAIGRARFHRALDGVERLGRVPRRASAKHAGDRDVVDRIATRAPALIMAALGEVLAYEIDPLTADPVVIHEMRIEAKKLRYTLEAFEGALEPGPTLIKEVTALQDAAGEMHDAIVAGARARSMLEAGELHGRERDAVEAFAALQDGRVRHDRPIVRRNLAAVRGRAFRESIGRAIAAMGTR
ncbi:MAG TPA: CHAD domain-containing protein [Candidatus Limnocylindrales bacterium]